MVARKWSDFGGCDLAREGQPVLVCQTLGDNRVRQDTVEAFGTKTALAVPVYQEGKLFAVLMVLNRLDGQLLNSEDEQRLSDYAKQLVL